MILVLGEGNNLRLMLVEVFWIGPPGFFHAQGPFFPGASQTLVAGSASSPLRCA